MITKEILAKHSLSLNRAIADTVVTNAEHRTMEMVTAINAIMKLMRQNHDRGGDLFFIGNGGSASIASHMAVDYTKNGRIRARAFNDASLITCFSNDYSYERLFGAAMNAYAARGDILVAISSSGESPNVLHAAREAKDTGCTIITLSSFAPNNSLRTLGDWNFYVPIMKGKYGIAEIAHLTVLHTILDFICEEK